MSWREVASLEELAAGALVRRLVFISEQKIQGLLGTVTRDTLRKHCKHNTHNHSRSNFTRKHCVVCSVTMEEDEDLEENYEEITLGMTDSLKEQSVSERSITQECCMDRLRDEVKVILDRCRIFWRDLPGAGPRRSLQDCLDLHTEVNPKHDDNFGRHFTRLCLKMILLENVFIDRDYGDRDKKCVVPFLWEKWMCEVIKELKVLPIKQLSIYGAMYPSILESVVQTAPNITELTLSHINITDDLLITVSKSCPNLEKLYLQHSYPWMVLSTEGFCKAFFKGQSFSYIMSCLDNNQLNQITLSFDKLKELELNFGQTNAIREFHLLILSLYKNVKFVYSQWKTNFFEEGYENYCEDVIQESISKSGSLSIDNLFIKADYLYDLTKDDMRCLLWNCPLVTELRFDCKTSPGRSSLYAAKTIGNKLSSLAEENMNITSMYVNVAREDRLTRALILPILVNRASMLTDLTLEAGTPFENINVSLIIIILDVCTVIKRLRIRVWARSMLEFPSDEHVVTFTERASLKEIWLHEDGPGESEEESPSIYLWLHLLNSLLMAAPHLHTLSFTLCEGLERILEKCSSNVRSLHVHITDGYEWQPTLGQLTKLISNHSNLHDLYLEEVAGEMFWVLQQKYSNTRLKLHWGNLEGWPRS